MYPRWCWRSRGRAQARRSGLLVAALALWAAAVLAGCTPHPIGPARTLDSYLAKATTTAASAQSAVATVHLAAETSGRSNGFGPYLSELISEQEDGLNGVIGTFASIQPPDDRAEEIGSQLQEALSRALDHVTAVRVAVRRGQLHDLPHVAAPLAEDIKALEAFQEEHK